MTTLYERCWCDLASAVLLGHPLSSSSRKGLPILAAPSAPTSSHAYTSTKASTDTNATTTPQPTSLFPPSGFFDPYDQKAWESASLVRHARAITEMQKREESGKSSTSEKPDEVERLSNNPTDQDVNDTMVEATPQEDVPQTPSDTVLPSTMAERAAQWSVRFRQSISNPLNIVWTRLSKSEAQPQPQPPAALEDDKAQEPGDKSAVAEPPTAENSQDAATPRPAISDVEEQQVDLPIPFAWILVAMWRRLYDFFSRQYDLTPYGFPVVVDFRWGRS
ncbi:hypothetical protein FRB99_008412 [Tulasnella sp. 403]|nr:hypothetical protein FRB99_008412 [Tulasnella sp. 403]